MGHMLGSSCSSCCGDECCSFGTLPESVSVSLSGPAGEQEQGPNLLTLVFSSCFGSGAGGSATAPGGEPGIDGGAIFAVSLTEAGSGYAKLGRVAPTLTITGGGEGATFTPTLESTNDECGVPTWKIASVSVSGGSGYADGEGLTVTVAAGDTTVTTASLSLSTERSEPEVTATVSGGSDAELSVNLATADSQVWSVDSVSVDQGGSGYTDFTPVTFEVATGDIENAPATAYVRTNREEPTVSASVQGDGTGATLQVNLTKDLFDDFWYVSGITVTNGGSGYTDGDLVTATTSDQEDFGLYAEAVVTGGVVTGVTIYYGGAYYRDGGVIQSVDVFYGGEYYRETPDAVTVNNGGKYYREGPDEPPYVAEVSVTVRQGWPGGLGSGATFAATVDSDTSSETFGQITSIELTNGGSGYLGWQWIYSCDCDWVYAAEEPTDHVVIAHRLPPLSAPYILRPCVYAGSRCQPPDIQPCDPADPPPEPPPEPPPPSPPLGACWVPGGSFGGAGGLSCSLRTQGECQAIGGTWSGPGTACPPPPDPDPPDPDPPESLGACTYISRSQFGGSIFEEEVCELKTAAGCANVNGVFSGAGTQCQ
jgi:hypothetical protein